MKELKELVEKFERACLGSKTTAEVAKKMGCDLDTVNCLIKIFPETWKKDLSSDCEVEEKLHRKQESKGTNKEEAKDVYVIHSSICRYEGFADLLAVLSQKGKFVITSKTLDIMEALYAKGVYKENFKTFKKCFYSNFSCFDYRKEEGDDEISIIQDLAMVNGWIILTADVDFAIRAKVEECKVFCVLGSEYRFESILESLDYRGGKKSEAGPNEKASESAGKMVYESTPNLIHEKRKKTEFESITGKVVEQAKKVKDSIDTEAIKETFAAVTAKMQDKATEVTEAISEAKIAKNGFFKLFFFYIVDGKAMYKLPENTVAKILYDYDERFLKEAGNTAPLLEESVLYTAELESDTSDMVIISRYEVRESCTNVLYRSFYKKISSTDAITIDDPELYAFAVEAVEILKG